MLDSLSLHYGPGVDSTSNITSPACVGLSPSHARCREILESQIPISLEARPGL